MFADVVFHCALVGRERAFAYASTSREGFGEINFAENA